jgi:hypothetical protein
MLVCCGHQPKAEADLWWVLAQVAAQSVVISSGERAHAHLFTKTSRLPYTSILDFIFNCNWSFAKWLCRHQVLLFLWVTPTKSGPSQVPETVLIALRQPPCGSGSWFWVCWGAGWGRMSSMFEIWHPPSLVMKNRVYTPLLRKNNFSSIISSLNRVKRINETTR